MDHQAFHLGARHVAKNAARLTLAFWFLVRWTSSTLVIAQVIQQLFPKLEREAAFASKVLV